MDEVSSELLEAMERRRTVIGHYLVGVSDALPTPEDNYEIEADSVLTQTMPVLLKIEIEQRLKGEMLTKEQRRLLLTTLDTIDERTQLLNAGFKKQLH